jgi:hypothetical protein
MWRRAALLVVFDVLLFPALASACSCAGSGSACTLAPQPGVDVIVLARMSGPRFGAPRPSPVEEGAPPRFFLGERPVSLDVLEVYKGEADPELTVYTASSEAACGFPFRPGVQYIVYAYRKDGKLHTSLCSGNRVADEAAADLEYLRQLKGMPEVVRISGEYKRYTYDPNFHPTFQPSIMDHARPPEETYNALAPMTGEQVRITHEGGQTWVATVDDSGWFDVAGLPPGKYSVEPSVPEKYSDPEGMAAFEIMRGHNRVELKPKQCAEFVYRTHPDGHIEGKIVDQSGRPLGNVEVVIWRYDRPPKELRLEHTFRHTYNAADGTFVLDRLPPGQYVVAAYVFALPQGFPARPEDRDKLTAATLRFYPGPEAQILRLELGQHLSDLVFTIPFNPAQWKSVESH